MYVCTLICEIPISTKTMQASLQSNIHYYIINIHTYIKYEHKMCYYTLPYCNFEEEKFKPNLNFNTIITYVVT